jgi:predicted alpha/beta-hydrolase family hydrolase
VSTVPLKHGELRHVPLAALIVAPAATNLEYLLMSPTEQPLHAYLWRGMQIPVAGPEGLDMLLGCIGRDAVRGFHLQKTFGIKKIANCANDLCPMLKIIVSYTHADHLKRKASQ